MSRKLILLAALVVASCADAEEAPVAPAASDGPQALEGITAPAEGGAVHLIRMVQRGDSYAFEPDSITIPAGDVVRFVMTGGQPESVAFEPTSTVPEISAFVAARSLDRGVLLTESGQSYDVSFQEAPPGRYPFHSVPHLVQGMRGVITIAGSSGG